MIGHSLVRVESRIKKFMPHCICLACKSPLGTQQMTTVLHDLFRAGIRNAKTPQTSQMMFYTMAHAPGTTATMWRRNYYNYLAHGMTRLNLYEMRPVTASYTENYVDVGYGLYGAVRTALAETAEFEDIMEPGTAVASGDVGLWCSDAGADMLRAAADAGVRDAGVRDGATCCILPQFCI